MLESIRCGDDNRSDNAGNELANVSDMFSIKLRIHSLERFPHFGEESGRFGDVLADLDGIGRS